ncbi:MAG: polysaccharide pyruvyl transferase family protein [Schleiferiaceae bacterium]|nr:polysaccharide pyruvyl transferase family protein [Schleiferiaceae bacterium]
MQKNNFLLIGGNFINKGAEAMLLTVATHLQTTYPTARIYAICHPEEKEVAQRFGIIPLTVERSSLANFARKVVRKITQTFLGRKYPYADETPVAGVRSMLDCTAIIDVSGFAYHDGRGYQQPLETLKALAVYPNAKFYMMPQAWGPFNDSETAKNTKAMLERAAKFYVRDAVSEKYVAKLLQVDADTLQRKPDIAFNFGVLNSENTGHLQAFLPKGKKGTAYGISPNMRIFEKGPRDVMANPYGKLLVQLSLALLNKGGSVLLIPNEMRPGGGVTHPDDLQLCTQLYEAILQENPVLTEDQLQCPTTYMSAYEVKHIISHLDILIASRFHSLIFGLSQEIPCIAISWSHKYKELFKLFDQERYVVEEEDMELAKLLVLVGQLEDESSSVRATLQQRLPELQSGLKKVFEAI